MQLIEIQNNRSTRSTQYPAHNEGWPAALGLARTTHFVPTISNTVYMKRLGMLFNRLLMANSRHYIDLYETWLKPSHASYTLNR
jgi:hypothetical protein